MALEELRSHDTMISSEVDQRDDRQRFRASQTRRPRLGQPLYDYIELADKEKEQRRAKSCSTFDYMIVYVFQSNE